MQKIIKKLMSCFLGFCVACEHTDGQTVTQMNKQSQIHRTLLLVRMSNK